MRVLITDGEQRAALAVVRSLARAGHQPYVCAAATRSLAGASRYCQGHAAVAHPLHHPTDFTTGVHALGARWQIDALIPITEASLLCLLPPPGCPTPFHLPFVDAARFARICDKVSVAAAAREVGISIPEQLVVDTPNAAAASDAWRTFPVVVKPARSVAVDGDARSKVGVRYATDPASLRQVVGGLPPGAFPLLLQQRIVGPGVGIFLLLRGGAVAAAFAHRRIREKPVTGGVSVFRESTAMDEGLLRRSRALLDRFGWEGVAMVEYKLDRETGEPYIMEVNGRFWGSLQLAIDAGVDFPAILLDPNRTQAPDAYRVGVRSRWEWGEIDHLIARLRHEPEVASGLRPGRLGAVRDFLSAFRPGNRLEVLRLSDPAPFLEESREWLRAAFHGS